MINADSAMTANISFGYRNNDGTNRQSRTGTYNLAASIKVGDETGYQFTATAVEHK